MISTLIKTVGNKITMKNIQRFFCGCIFLLLPVTAYTENNITTDIIEISSGIGYYNFDDGRNVDDAAMVTLGLGLQFSRQWLMLLHYSGLKYDSAGPKLIKQKYHLDAHYFFNTENALRPYVVAGVGLLDIENAGIKSNENMFNAGLGISYKVTPSWFVRTDARIFQTTSGDFQDNALTLTVGYRFNGGEQTY